MSNSPSAPIRSERAIVVLIAAVQFVNILDFVMVMPLGPDFSRALGIPTARLGLIGGSYTLAAAAAGILGSRWLDRFDRRKALAVAMGGLVLGTALGGFAVGMRSLVAARVLAGFFGGPATSLAISIITDVIPAERRGKAIGSVMGAFSVASVLGVPAGLWLAQGFGWYAPFFAVAGVGVGVAASAVFLLPPLTGHLVSRGGPALSMGAFLKRPSIQLSFLMTAVAMAAGFLVIPNISSYLQGNLSYPRERIGILYMVGGAVSFVAMRTVGLLVDRYGSFRVAAFGSTLLSGVLYVFFCLDKPWLPPMAMFVLFMTAMSFRNVAYNTLTSKVPGPHERARFQSLQSAVQHLASAGGAMLSAWLLTDKAFEGAAVHSSGSAGHVPALVGMRKVALLSIALTALLPLLMRAVERRLKRRGVPPDHLRQVPEGAIKDP